MEDRIQKTAKKKEVHTKTILITYDTKEKKKKIKTRNKTGITTNKQNKAQE
jgi:hypothetical protein